MSGRRILVQEVLVYLGAEEHTFLAELRREGLFEADEFEAEQAEDLRFAKILMEELGVNAAGVDVALHLKRRLIALEQRTQALANALAIESERKRGS